MIKVDLLLNQGLGLALRLKLEIREIMHGLDVRSTSFLQHRFPSQL